VRKHALPVCSKAKFFLFDTGSNLGEVIPLSKKALSCDMKPSRPFAAAYGGALAGGARRGVCLGGGGGLRTLCACAGLVAPMGVRGRHECQRCCGSIVGLRRRRWRAVR
jgi:hypothetical protein